MSDGGVVLVTGAARRIGRAVAVRLARGGRAVAVHHRGAESAADAAETARLVTAAGGRAACFAADLADAGACAGLVAAVATRLGGITALVNNAALFRPSSAAADAAEDLDAHWAVNVRAPWILSAAVVPGMRAAGGGRIVNLGDVFGERPLGGHAGYSVSKAALHAMTRSLARAFAPAVTVNAVAPGIVDFPDGEGGAADPALVRLVPAARGAVPDEIAAAVAFFVEGPSYVTGEILHVDGGRRLR